MPLTGESVIASKSGEGDMAEARQVNKENRAAAIKGAIAGCGVRPGDARLLFKADIYSYLGVYAKNVYGLRPTIFEERL